MAIPTEAEYWDRLFQLEANVREIRALLDTHTGAAAERQRSTDRHFAEQKQVAEYYGEQVVRALNQLRDRISALERRVDTPWAERDQAA